MSAKLQSRLPKIAADLPWQVDAVIHRGVSRIAADAARNAPDAEPFGEGLPASIEAREGALVYGGRSRFAGVAAELGFRAPTSKGVRVEPAYGVYAAWYWYFLEFGTSRSDPQPFMLPAFESGIPSLLAELRSVMRRL